jgi:hypothetical protein
LTKKHIFEGLLVGSATGATAGVVAGLVAGITLKYIYDKYIPELEMQKKIKSVSKKTLKKHDKCLII